MDGQWKEIFTEKIEAIYRLSRIYPVCYSFYDAWFNMMLHIPICNNRRVRIKERVFYKKKKKKKKKKKLCGEKIKTNSIVSYYKKVKRKKWTVEDIIKWEKLRHFRRQTV